MHIRFFGARPEHDAPELPKGYGDETRVQASERVALAGYRLAERVAELVQR